MFGIREGEHPFIGRVHVEGLDRTTRGFLLQFEERWDAEGQEWYCRELMHRVVDVPCKRRPRRPASSAPSVRAIEGSTPS